MIGRARCLALLCACTGAGTPLHADPAPPRPPLPAPPASPKQQVWRVQITMPDDGPIVTNLDSAVATREAQPTVLVAGRIAKTTRPTATLEKPGVAVGNSHGELIYAVEYPHGKDVTEIHTLSGDTYEIPLGNIRNSTRWYDLSPGVLSIMHTPTKVFFARYDHGAVTPTWATSLAGAAIDDAVSVGWFEDGAPIVSVTSPTGVELNVLNLADGSSKQIAALAGGRVVTAVNAKTFAIVYEAPPADCSPCSRVEVRDLGTGHVVSQGTIPASPATFRPPTIGSGTVGFDGKLLWSYDYMPAHRSDVLGAGADKQCDYAVYDLAKGTKLRSLTSASGDWKALSDGCRVRALLPLADGGALAVAVVGPRAVEIVRFRTAP